MTAAVILQPQDVSGRNARQGRNPFQAAAPTPAPAVAPPGLSTEMAGRFQALIDDVTAELMQGGQADRDTCRADAIALLVAASGQLGPDAEAAESPLLYLLREEQHKAAKALGSAAPAAAEPAAFTFMKV